MSFQGLAEEKVAYVIGELHRHRARAHGMEGLSPLETVLSFAEEPLSGCCVLLLTVAVRRALDDEDVLPADDGPLLALVREICEAPDNVVPLRGGDPEAA